MTKSKTIKLVAGFVGIAMFLTFVSVADAYTFSTNLTVGSRGVAVTELQKVLNASADTQVASTGAGSPGMETAYFGALTKAAVKKYQAKNGISPVAGYFGPITRAKLNAGGTTGTTGTGTTGTTLPTGGALSVSAAAQPANSLAPYSASRVPFTKVVLTAGSSDVTVNSLTVQRSGLAVDANFAGVVLLDENGMQIGIAKTLNSNHQAMVGEPFVVKAGTSKTVTIAGNMAGSSTVQAGQVIGLDVVAVNTTASVSGSLPITGATHTINANLAIGSVTINTSSFDPNSAGSQPIGTTGYRFTGFKVTAGSAEDLTLKSIRWNQSGSAGSSDLSNVVTVVNGTQYPTTVSADGKYFSTVFPSGIVISKGNSIDVYVQGDVTGSGAASRVAEFDIYKNTDLYLVGNTYGYGVTAAVGTGTVLTTATHVTVLNTSSNPWLQGSTLSITAGSVTTISKASEVASANIATNVPNQILGGFATNFSGEPVSIQSLKVLISTSSTAGTTANSPYSAITNISLVDENGAVIAGPVDAAVGDGSTTYGGQASPATSYAALKFTDTVTFPVGRHVYKIMGKIPSAWANGTTINLFIKPSTDFGTPTGQTTGNTVSLSDLSSAFSMNQMTVKGAALTVSVSAQPTSQTIVAGVQEVTLANYILDATASGEDLRMSSFPVNITDSSISDLTGCQLYKDGVALNTGSRVVNGSAITSATSKTFSLDNSLVVPKGTTVTLTLKCNVSSAATASVSVNATALVAGDFTVTGQTSGNSVTPTVVSSAGAVFSISTGSLSLAIDSSSPSYYTVAGGSTGVKVGVAKLRASNESMTLNKIGLKISTGSSANVVGATLKNAAGSVIGTVVFPQGTTPTATSTLTSPLNLPKDTDVLVTVYADFAAIGASESGVQGANVVIDPLNAEAVGLSSGTTLGTSQSSSVSGVRVFKSYPTVVLDNLSPTGIADGKFMRFKVTANNSGSVGLSKFNFSIATSTVTVSNVSLYAYTDSGYSSPITSDTNGQVGAAALTLVYWGGLNPAYATATPTTTIQVPAGGTIYFELRGSVSGVQSGSTVVATLLGDAAYITSAHLGSGVFANLSSTTGAVAAGATRSSFLWAANATTTDGVNDERWANSYGLVGFPSSGLIQTRGQ